MRFAGLLGQLALAVTFGNLLAGSLAMLCCLATLAGQRPQSAEQPAGQPATSTAPAPAPAPLLQVAALLVVVALLLDGADGWLARRSAATTAFGAQLDALADMVSFGVAPAALLVTVALQSGPPAAEHAAAAASVAYVAAAALRLARFVAAHASGGRAVPGASGVAGASGALPDLAASGAPGAAASDVAAASADLEAAPQPFAPARFSGLPAPAAGVALTALIALHAASPLRGSAAALLVAALPLAALGLAVLMVTRLSYVHMGHALAGRCWRSANVPFALLALGLLAYAPAAAVALAAWTYVAAGWLGARPAQAR